MLRVVPLTFVILISGAAIAAAEPQLGDDLATCRDRQAEAMARATACDNLLNADRVTGKDKAVALSVRGNTLINKRDYVHAIETLSTAVDPIRTMSSSSTCGASPTSARARTTSR